MRWFWSLHGVVGKPSEGAHERPCADACHGQGAVRSGLAAMAGVGEAAGDALASAGLASPRQGRPDTRPKLFPRLTTPQSAGMRGLALAELNKCLA